MAFNVGQYFPGSAQFGRSPTVPAIQQFDVAPGLNALRLGEADAIERQKRETLSEIGQQMAGGDVQGAASAAHSAGMVDVGLKLQDYGQQQQDRAREQSALVRAEAQRAADLQKANQIKFANWFSRNANAIGDDPEKLNVFKQAAIQATKYLKLGDGSGFNNLTLDNLHEATAQMEWVSAIERGELTAPKTVKAFEDGREQTKVFNRNTGEWDNLGGSKAPTKGQTVRTFDSEGNVISEFTQGGTGETSPSAGKLSKDFEYILDEHGRNTGEVRPVKGSKAEQDYNVAQEKIAGRKRQAMEESGIVVEDADRALALMDGNPNWTTGVVAAGSKWLPGTPAFEVEELVGTIRDIIAFDRLRTMRLNSPTGGAVGQLSDSEREALSRVIGSLNISQNYKKMRYNLVRVKERFLNAVHGDIKKNYGYSWNEVDETMEATGKTREQVLQDIVDNVTPIRKLQ